jgi:hypothetical protein
MGPFLIVGVVAILVVLATLILALAASMGMVLVGWVVSLVFPLSAFEGTIIALIASVGAGYMLYQVINIIPSSLVSGLLAKDDDDWEDEDDDDEPDPPIVPWRQRRPSQASPKPSSKRKGKR